MGSLRVQAEVLSSQYPIKNRFAIVDIVISVSGAGGAPVPGLLENEIQIRVVGSGPSAYVPNVSYHGQVVPVLGEDGEPVMVPSGEDGGMVELTTILPGPARGLGLPGYYCMTVWFPNLGIGRLAMEVAVNHQGDCGQTLSPMDVVP